MHSSKAHFPIPENTRRETHCWDATRPPTPPPSLEFAGPPSDPAVGPVKGSFARTVIHCIVDRILFALGGVGLFFIIGFWFAAIFKRYGNAVQTIVLIGLGLAFVGLVALTTWRQA